MTVIWKDAPAVTPETTVYYTTKQKDLVLVTKWQDRPIVVSGIGKANGVTLLGYEGKVKYSATGNKLTITPPVITPATNPCQYAWVFKVKGRLIVLFEGLSGLF